jgi:hypothetical protein
MVVRPQYPLVASPQKSREFNQANKKKDSSLKRKLGSLALKAAPKLLIPIMTGSAFYAATDIVNRLNVLSIDLPEKKIALGATAVAAIMTMIWSCGDNKTMTKSEKPKTKPSQNKTASVKTSEQTKTPKVYSEDEYISKYGAEMSRRESTTTRPSGREVKSTTYYKNNEDGEQAPIYNTSTNIRKNGERINGEDESLAVIYRSEKTDANGRNPRNYYLIDLTNGGKNKPSRKGYEWKFSDGSKKYFDQPKIIVSDKFYETKGRQGYWDVKQKH